MTDQPWPKYVEIGLQPPDDVDVVFCRKAGCHEPTRFTVTVRAESGGFAALATYPLCPDHIREFLLDSRITKEGD